MGVLQALCDLHSEMEGFLPVQDPLLFHVLLQRDAIDQFHHDEVCAFRSGNIVNLHDIGMTEHGNRLALRMEAAAEFFISGKFIFQYFDCHQSVQPMAASFIYNGHAAGTDILKNLVPTVKQPSDILIHK